MTDWNKLKVVDLKAALKQRGLPQTGLKPALVARLAEAESQDGSESEATVQEQEDEKHDASSAASPDTISTALPPSGLSTELLPDEPFVGIPEAQLGPPDQIGTADVVVPEDELPFQMEDSNATTAQSVLAPPQSADSIPSSQPSETVAVGDSHTSALPSVEPQEAVEDRLKRKRRSQSPPILSVDAARKRIRTEDASQCDEGVVTTQMDVDWVENHSATDAGKVNTAAEEVDAAESVLYGPTIVDTSKQEVLVESVDGVPDQTDVDGNGIRHVLAGTGNREVTLNTHTTLNTSGDASKTRDSRFTSFFPKTTPSHPPHSLPSDDMEYETDRIVSPARHPATSALYIRNFMRPLNASHLQSHLAALATPPSQETDIEIILNFYLDPIKTHAFVTFTNTSAASRVRNAFHDRIWPDEKTRKPLWVDFLPVEKAEEWIAEEMASNSGGRGQAKKWEVIYHEDEDRNVTVTLAEFTTVSHQMHHIRQPVGQAPVAPRNFPQPPLGPRAFVSQPQKSAANVARLDQLFGSTATKPVLYFKPVSKEIANRRLDNIDAALSKEDNAGRRVTGEIHRYTFEDNDILVDRGPEIFSGIRPPLRGGRGGGGRGGGGGNFRSRGVGYGGDMGGYDRRYDSYRSERRTSRDDRRY